MKRPGLWLATVAFLTVFLGPFFWQVLTSMWPDGQLTQPLPSTLTLDNYASVLWGRPFLRVMLNSLLAAMATTFFCMAVGASAAFALAMIPVGVALDRPLTG